MAKELLTKIEIKQVLPCIADVSKIRVVAELDGDIREVLPYLNAQIEGAIYIVEKSTLTFSKNETLITLYPCEIKMARVENRESAEKILDWLRRKINEVWQEKDKIEPLFERRNELKPLDVYAYLPQTNCRKCGEESCLTFALKLIQRKVSAMGCSPLFTPELAKKRGQLLSLLRETGYPTPDAF
jgi:ArsR family metal-binding transcriptional regulator